MAVIVVWAIALKLGKFNDSAKPTKTVADERSIIATCSVSGCTKAPVKAANRFRYGSSNIGSFRLSSLRVDILPR